MPPDFVLPSPGVLLTDTEPPAASGRGHPPPALPAGDDAFLTRIAVRSLARIVIVPVHDIVRLEAEDNYVRIWAERPFLHKETLTSLCSRLDPAVFLRVHRSHAVNLTLVRELRPQLHGEYTIVLADGTAIVSGRSYRARIQQVFGLGRVDPA